MLLSSVYTRPSPTHLPDSQPRTLGNYTHSLNEANSISTTPVAHHLNYQAKPKATIPKAPATRKGLLVIIGTAAA